MNTLNTEQYDLLVLGSGEGGRYLAWTLAKEGRKVLVIERKLIGGSCPNIACLPSKNIIHSAKVASYLARSAEFGITTENSHLDMSAVRERKRRMVSDLVNMHLAKFKESGAELLMGSGRFLDSKTIEVTLPGGGTRVVRGENIVINTGSRATLDAVPGLMESGPLTHVEALELDEVPKHLIVMGGGFVGLELAHAMRRFGSRVTIVERSGHLLHNEDEDIREGLLSLLRDEGIEVVLNATVTSVEGKSGESIRVHAVQSGSETVLTGTHLLVARGRTPNTKGIGLELAGVELTERGHVKVNERLETTAPGVWAMGDCAGSPQFTHISYDDFRIVRDNMKGGHRTTTGRQVPFCLYTDPEFARIGLSETEAKAKGISYRLAKIPMAANLRTRTLSETRGFMKALIGSTSDNILGFAVFGIGGGEIMSTVQVAMIAGLPYTSLRDAVFAHPTLLEGVISLFSNVPPMTKKSKGDF